jgi:hypothetical protein
MRSIIHQLGLPIALLVTVLFTIAALWLLPIWQVRRSAGYSTKNGFARTNEARKTIAQIIGGLFVLAGFYASIRTLDLQRASQVTDRFTLDLQRDGQVTDRFTKAIDQLGGVQESSSKEHGSAPLNLTKRLGGIYALDRIAHDSPRDQWAIVQVLSADIRANQPAHEPIFFNEPQSNGCWSEKHLQISTIPPRTDYQAMLKVITSRNVSYDLKDRSIDLRSSNLSNADFSETNGQANLVGALLTGSTFNYTNFNRARISDADFTGALAIEGDFTAADASNAQFVHADLAESFFPDAVLIGADFTKANLTGTDFTRARLSEADFEGADLSGAIFTGVIGLTQSQIDVAGCFDHKTLFPVGSGLKAPPSKIF